MPAAPRSMDDVAELMRVLCIRNTTGKAQELWIEPLGDRVELKPNVLYELTATDALEEIDFEADGFTVHGWIVRVSAVAENGNKQTVWEISPQLTSPHKTQPLSPQGP